MIIECICTLKTTSISFSMYVQTKNKKKQCHMKIMRRQKKKKMALAPTTVPITR